MTGNGRVPFTPLDPLPPQEFRQVWLETVFDQLKWDPQIGDIDVLSSTPLLLSAPAWQEISQMAEQLSAEAFAAESELLRRPELHGLLGLPKAVRKLWQKPQQVKIGTPGDVRIIRFDFHYTSDGWRISEANIDTPGGWIESSGFARQMQTRYPNVQLAGDPPLALARAIHEVTGPGGRVALMHATAYTEDRAMMMYFNRLLEKEGLRGSLISPAQLAWEAGRASICTNWVNGEASYLVRFFPAEWLVDLPKSSRWSSFFNDCRVPSTNPTSALLVQSKRFPLVWDQLDTPLPTWRKLLPLTCQPRKNAGFDQDTWVLKPVLGRAGESIVIRGVTKEKVWKETYRSAMRHPSYWIAQQRFETLPVIMNGSSWYPSIGVYTVGGKAAGIYARAAAQPVVNETAVDLVVFVGQP